MNHAEHKRSTFSGKIGFVLSAAGASVGLGNIWRFPYLAAKYGGGIFLLVYIILAMTFGYTMIVAETSLGRMTGKSPVGAFGAFGSSGWLKFGGWINAIIPILIVPYYSVIGGWVVKYLAEYVLGHGSQLAADGYFGSFISNGVSTELCFVIFAVLTLAVIFAGVENGIERVSKFMMPVLVVLSIIIAVYSVTRPGALAGVTIIGMQFLDFFDFLTNSVMMPIAAIAICLLVSRVVGVGRIEQEVLLGESTFRRKKVFNTMIRFLCPFFAAIILLSSVANALGWISM